MSAWLCVSVCEDPNAHVDVEAHICLTMQSFHYVGFSDQNKVIRLSSRWDILPAQLKKIILLGCLWCKLNEIFIFLRIVMKWHFLHSGGPLTEMILGTGKIAQEGCMCFTVLVSNSTDSNNTSIFSAIRLFIFDPLSYLYHSGKTHFTISR